VETPRDGDGNRNYLQVPGAYYVGYAYTQRNQLKAVNGFAHFDYDPSGNMIYRGADWIYASGASCAFDNVNRVTQIDQGNAWSVFSHSNYQFDKAGREVARWRDEEGGKGERFTYNNTNQVTNVSYKADNVWTENPANPLETEVFNYAPGKLNRDSVTRNGVTTNYGVAALNQYTSVGSTGLGYDGNFNLTAYNDFQGVYDPENHLVGGSMRATYDGLGRCVRRTTPSGTVLLTYDGWKPILEWGVAGNWTARNVYGAGADEILARQDSAGHILIYKQDQHGNVMAVLTDNGDVTEKYTYEAFGKPRIFDKWGNSRAATAIDNRFLFQGREWIAELGIYDYRHRMYHPGVGRFLQTDPTGFDAGDMNLFRYVADDPIDGGDPTGLMNSLATIANHLAWFEGGSTLSSREDDLWRQGQARFAEPTGNYKDHNIDHHAKADLSDSGRTRYTISKVEETNGILAIQPTLDWWVRPYLKYTDVVKRELEHVSRWLWWQSKGGDGWVKIREFNRAPNGVGPLTAKMENARLEEKGWQRDNIHANGRHDLSRNREVPMDPAEIQRLIENVGPDEFPHLRN
jgi:RHS repeat-associated protein